MYPAVYIFSPLSFCHNPVMLKFLTSLFSMCRQNHRTSYGPEILNLVWITCSCWIQIFWLQIPCALGSIMVPLGGLGSASCQGGEDCEHVGREGMLKPARSEKGKCEWGPHGQSRDVQSYSYRLRRVALERWF